jgi:hypothetical protein
MTDMTKKMLDAENHAAGRTLPGWAYAVAVYMPALVVVASHLLPDEFWWRMGITIVAALIVSFSLISYKKKGIQ